MIHDFYIYSPLDDEHVCRPGLSLSLKLKGRRYVASLLPESILVLSWLQMRHPSTPLAEVADARFGKAVVADAQTHA